MTSSGNKQAGQETKIGRGQKEQSGGIQIQPPPNQEFYNLYDWVPITVTCTDPNVVWIFFSTGPETPAPDGNNPGHTFMFDRYNCLFNEDVNGTIRIKAVGPNTDTKVTVYAWAFDHEPVSIELNFVAIENPPDATLGVMSLEGVPLQNKTSAIHLFRAVYIDNQGNPLPGDIAWTSEKNDIISPLSISTPILDDGTTTNGFSIDYLGGNFATSITATAPDGMTKTQFGLYGMPYAVFPSFKIDTDPSQTTLTATYTGEGTEPGTEMLWEAYPADKVTFTNRTTQISDGSTHNTITYKVDEPLTAYISASTFNPDEGRRNYGILQLTLQPASDTIEITPDAPPLHLFNADQLIDGKYIGDKQFNAVVWSVDPDENPDCAITFDPNPSPATAEDGGRTTQTKMMVYGPNQPTTVTVYAHSVDGDFVKSEPTPLDFLPVNQPPQSGWIELVSLEGNPLAEGGRSPLIQATYRLGAMRAVYEPLTWEIINDPSGTVSLTTPHGETDVDGIMTNGVTTTSTSGDPIPFTVKVTSDDYGDIGTLDLTFLPKADVPALPGQVIMTINSADGSDLTFEDKHPLSVPYSGPEVTWLGFPSDRLIFGKPNPVTVSGGVSSNTVQVHAGPDIPDAAVMTVHFNKDIGAYDYGYLPLSFQASQVQEVVGITIDKAYAQNTETFVDPSNHSQVIACQLQLTGDNNQNQQVLLPTDPQSMVASLVDAQGNDLKKQSGTYYVTTDKNGQATFFVGSENPATFTINTQWQNKPQPASATLTVATNAPSGTWPAPNVPDLNGTTLKIPSGCPAPTFKVTIPSDVAAGTNVALLLNNRLVYRGLVDPAQAGGVDVAYCALDLTGTNTLVYLPETSVHLSKPCTFTVDTTNGNPQKGPCPGLKRELLAPTGLDASQTVGAGDILPPGLSVYIEPYDGMVPDDDVITAFFYLKGTDVLTQQMKGTNVTINNIVMSEPYPVKSGGPLSKGQSVPLTLPQWAAAGYASGKLQVDYMVVGKKNGTRWSEISPTVPFNTTIPFPSA